MVRVAAPFALILLAACHADPGGESPDAGAGDGATDGVHRLSSLAGTAGTAAWSVQVPSGSAGSPPPAFGNPAFFDAPRARVVLVALGAGWFPARQRLVVLTNAPAGSALRIPSGLHPVPVPSPEPNLQKRRRAFHRGTDAEPDPVLVRATDRLPARRP
jgi:hypothetical protein